MRSMKSKNILIIAIIGFLLVGGVLALRQRPSGGATETADYEELTASINNLIEALDTDGPEATQPDDLLSIEPFEIDPDNEELGEIY